MSVESLVRSGGRTEVARPRSARRAVIPHPYRPPKPRHWPELSELALRLLWLLVGVCTLTGTVALVALVRLL